MSRPGGSARDQVWAMRAGRCVGGRRTDQTTSQEIVSLITGALAA